MGNVYFFIHMSYLRISFEDKKVSKSHI